MKTHMQTHSGKKPYKCDQCQKTFSQSGHMRTHMQTHSGEKPYKCNQCQKIFSCLSGMKTHLQWHSGEKPYKCDQCEKTFSYLSSMKTHLRTHSGEKPRKCDQCQKTFSELGQWRPICRRTVERSLTSAHNATMQLPEHKTLKITLWHTLEKGHANATSVTFLQSDQAKWRITKTFMVEKQSNNLDMYFSRYF